MYPSCAFLQGGRVATNKTEPSQEAKWAIQDSNLGPLPYQRSALTD